MRSHKIVHDLLIINVFPKLKSCFLIQFSPKLIGADSDSSPGTTMNLRKFRKATAKKRQLLMDSSSGPAMSSKRKRKKSESKSMEELTGSESNNTMTLEQFTDIVLASEGMTVNNNNNDVSKKNEEKNAMVATILQNKDLTVEVKTTKSKPVVLSPRENNLNFPANSVVVSVKPRLQQHLLVEEWLQKIPPVHNNSSSDSALNLSVKSPVPSAPSCSPINQYSTAATPSYFADSCKSRAIRDIQLAHTKDVHGNL